MLLGKDMVYLLYRGIMGNVIIGATVSLDGFMNDCHGDISPLYPDFEALRKTEMLQKDRKPTKVF